MYPLQPDQHPHEPVKRLFRIVCRLGDGVFRYSLMLVFPLLYAETGWLIPGFS